MDPELSDESEGEEALNQQPKRPTRKAKVMQALHPELKKLSKDQMKDWMMEHHEEVELEWDKAKKLYKEELAHWEAIFPKTAERVEQEKQRTKFPVQFVPLEGKNVREKMEELRLLLEELLKD